MMDSRVDISTFVQANNPGTYTPPVKSFTQNLGENKLFLVDATEPVLKRKYIALQKKLRDFDKSIKKDQEEVKSLRQEQESYSRNPSYGKSGEVEQDLLRQRNDLRVNEWFCCVAKEQTKLFTRDVLDRLNVTEDDPQDETISDDESSVTGTVDKRLSVHVKGKKIKKAGQHEFEDHTFKKLTKCFYCNGFIMIGLRGQGVWCKACKMSVHRKCRDNVPYCRGEIPVGKGQSLRIQHADEDDSDENSFSDDEDVPVPPPRRRALGPTVSLPAFRSNAFSDTAESKGSSTANNYCVALYDFGGEKDEDLKLCAGEKVKVINSTDEHWWEGSSKGKTGFFPASYVQVISPDDVILRCLYDFAGKEEDKLTIQAEQACTSSRSLRMRTTNNSLSTMSSAVTASSRSRSGSTPAPR
ncbi:unnamed protein product [Porites lobata]|uniref:Uncharacterized protein n=1 Tax=Porites lobata TaxID=104759 RepID=A0ABN8NAF5_9CNID|nr:unnamed protein product [Porites lobata]